MAAEDYFRDAWGTPKFLGRTFPDDSFESDVYDDVTDDVEHFCYIVAENKNGAYQTQPIPTKAFAALYRSELEAEKPVSTCFEDAIDRAVDDGESGHAQVLQDTYDRLTG